MILTGKCKEDFEKWLPKSDYSKYISKFNNDKLEVRFSYYSTFFCECSTIFIRAYIERKRLRGCVHKWYRFKANDITGKVSTLNKARVKAVEEANVLYNKS